MAHKVRSGATIILSGVLLLGCTALPAFAPTSTPVPTSTPYPTNTPYPTYTPYPTFTPLPPSPTPLPTNIALHKPVVIYMSTGWDTDGGAGVSPEDVTDGSLEYLRASLKREDGCLGYVNRDLSEPSSVIVTIDLEGSYEITKLRYHMGNVERAETWGADKIVTPLGEAVVTPGISYTSPTAGVGEWTEITGNIIASEVMITLEKTRTSNTTDWLFIGEIEIYGIPAPMQ